MLEILWGLKTTAMFDVWSFEHIFSGISTGHSVKKENRRHLKKHYPNIKFNNKTIIRIDLIFVLLLAYIWETLEHYLEEGIAGEVVQNWFAGVEYWPNRFIFDPLMLVFGYYIAKKYPKLVLPARTLSIAWLLVHIFIFPDSMFLHNWL